jgi:two-component system OmpR family response regulator
MRLLVIEDEPALAGRLRAGLRDRGYAVDLADNGIDGQFLGETEPYDAVVLDLGLPGRPGLEVLRNWRDAGLDLPVLVLTARDAWHERVDGLRAGADDYLGKPFHPEELAARLEALIRRRHGRADQHLQRGDVVLDLERQCVRIGAGPEQELTASEYRLLRLFMEHPGQLLSKRRLAEHLYEYDADPDSNVIEVYVTRLRRLLGKRAITTRRGQGYLFTPETR